MTAEVKEYVSVNEKDFGGKKSLEVTVNGKVLDTNLQKIIEAKVAELNTKIDAKYDAGAFDFKGSENISEMEMQKLTAQLKEIVAGFNEEITRIKDEYIGKTDKNRGQIQLEISQYFADKTLFIEKGAGLSALKGYANMDREAAKGTQTKELPLN